MLAVTFRLLIVGLDEGQSRCESEIEVWKKRKKIMVVK